MPPSEIALPNIKHHNRRYVCRSTRRSHIHGPDGRIKGTLLRVGAYSNERIALYTMELHICVSVHCEINKGLLLLYSCIRKESHWATE